MDLDADSDGGFGDSYLSIGGGFGAIILGKEANAAGMHGNKGVGGDYGGGGYYGGGNWTPATSGAKLPGSNDVGIRYSTLNIGGFQAGISFQPEAGSGERDQHR